jgi:hypothetical protein
VVGGGTAGIPGVGRAYVRGAGGVNTRDGAGPQPSDDTGGSLRDLVMRGVGIGVLGCASPGDVTPAPGYKGTMGLRVSGLLLPDSPSFPPLPINWRRVGDDAEFTCSQVPSAEKLLHKTLASVDRNILAISISSALE